MKTYLSVLHDGVSHQVVVSAVVQLVAIGDAVKVGEVSVEVNVVRILSTNQPVLLASVQELRQRSTIQNITNIFYELTKN